jgi:clan AA aspartic protease (TIGR02281 family)
MPSEIITDTTDLLVIKDESFGQLEDELFGPSFFIILRNFPLNSHALRPSHTETLLVTNEAGTFDVTASLNGSAPMVFILDTGATSLVIPRDLADRLLAQSVLSPTDLVGNNTATLANGVKIAETVYKLHSVTIGGRTVHDVRCSVGPVGTGTLLGQAVLTKFRSWSIDNERHVLVLN